MKTKFKVFAFNRNMYPINHTEVESLTAVHALQRAKVRLLPNPQIVSFRVFEVKSKKLVLSVERNDNTPTKCYQIKP